jgi:hypothetical protein
MAKRRIRITAIRRDPPDIKLLARALIVLARRRLAEEEAQRRQDGRRG